MREIWNYFLFPISDKMMSLSQEHSEFPLASLPLEQSQLYQKALLSTSAIIIRLN